MQISTIWKAGNEISHLAISIISFICNELVLNKMQNNWNTKKSHLPRIVNTQITALISLTVNMVCI